MGSVTEYVCLENYKLEGNRIVFCNVTDGKGKWPVDELPICGKGIIIN